MLSYPLNYLVLKFWLPYLFGVPAGESPAMTGCVFLISPVTFPIIVGFCIMAGPVSWLAEQVGSLLF